MSRGILSTTDYCIQRLETLRFQQVLDGEEYSKYKEYVEQFLSKRKLPKSTDYDPLKDLFLMVRKKYEEIYPKSKEVRYEEGYITGTTKGCHIAHNDVSRIYSNSSTVYLDCLMSSNLYDYAAITYLVVRFQDSEVQTFGFQYKLYLLNECCRKGQFPNYDGSKCLMQIMDKKIDQRGTQFISDLYWCMITFILCHEMAHIYLEHSLYEDPIAMREQEIEADSIGYDIFLRLLLDESKENEAQRVFHDFLYCAPMILMLFYKELFSMGYILFGEQIGNTHPYEKERIDNLLKISLLDKYEFNNKEGNDVLNAFFDASDSFINILYGKMINGKLHHIIKKGGYKMSSKHENERMDFLNEVDRELMSFATQKQLFADMLIGLWDSAAVLYDDETNNQEPMLGLIINYNNIPVRISRHVLYRQKDFLELLLDSGLAFGSDETRVAIVIIFLKLIYKFLVLSIEKISDAQAQTLIFCHRHGLYNNWMEEDDLIKQCSSANHVVITELYRMKCIDICNNKIQLRERVMY